MKNLKNTIAAIALMTVLATMTMTAKAGLLLSDKAEPGDQGRCEETASNDLKGIIIVGLNGIIIVGLNDMNMSDGIIIVGRTCRDGLLISD